MSERLTENLVKSFEGPQRGARLIWDADLKWLALRIFAPTKRHPKGARAFILSYWLSGTERRYRIGSWPDWSAAEARKEAKNIRQRIDRGEDPATDREGRRKASVSQDLVNRSIAQLADSAKWTYSRSDPQKGEPVIYFIRVGNAIKIGFTTDMQRRLTDFRGVTAEQIEFLVAGSGDRHLEARFHLLFDGFSGSNEFFRPDRLLRDFIDLAISDSMDAALRRYFPTEGRSAHVHSIGEPASAPKAGRPRKITTAEAADSL
jgi:hypothetical protein